MKPRVRLSTATAICLATLTAGVAPSALAQPTGTPPGGPAVDPATWWTSPGAGPVEDAPSASEHPALAVGVADLVATAVLVPTGVGVGVVVNDNGWEKASSLIGAGLGIGVHGMAAILHGANDGGRRLKDPVAAGFGWMFTSLAASGAGAGLGLVIGGERDGKPIGGIIAATSLIFLAPGIPLIADGELGAKRTPFEAVARSAPTETGPTRTNSPAMVAVGATFVTLSGLASIAGLAGVAATADATNAFDRGLGNVSAAVLASGLGLAVFVGTPLLVVGARRVPDVPTVSIGPGGVGVSGSF